MTSPPDLRRDHCQPKALDDGGVGHAPPSHMVGARSDPTAFELGHKRRHEPGAEQPADGEGDGAPFGSPAPCRRVARGPPRQVHTPGETASLIQPNVDVVESEPGRAQDPWT